MTTSDMVKQMKTQYEGLYQVAMQLSRAAQSYSIFVAAGARSLEENVALSRQASQEQISAAQARIDAAKMLQSIQGLKEVDIGKKDSSGFFQQREKVTEQLKGVADALEQASGLSSGKEKERIDEQIKYIRQAMEGVANGNADLFNGAILSIKQGAASSISDIPGFCRHVCGDGRSNGAIYCSSGAKTE